MFGAFFWERGWGLTLLTSLLPRAFLFLLLLSDLFQLLRSDGHTQLKFRRLEVKPSLEEDNRREAQTGPVMLQHNPPPADGAHTSTSTVHIDVWCIKFNSTAANCCHSCTPRAGCLPLLFQQTALTRLLGIPRDPQPPSAWQSRDAPRRGPPGPPRVGSAQRFGQNSASGQRELCLVLMRRLKHREGTKVTSCEEVRDDTATAKPKSPRPLPTTASPTSAGEGKASALANADPLWICENY